jgi:2-methylcitrate dehydratase PrpD
MTASARFAAHALGLTWQHLPAPAQRAAKLFLADTIGVGAAGARAPHAASIRTLEAADSRGTAHVLGAHGAFSIRSAAFANAFQIHAMEFDCVHEPAVLHPCSAVLGALIAECTGGARLTGADLGAALVAGVDIAVGLGLAARGRLTFFRPATAGIFGAVAALARARRMTQDQTIAAFGHALAFASGTMQAHVEGMPDLPLQVAAAARNAVIAADLAQAGIPGTRASIEGDFGYLALFEQGHDLQAAFAGLADNSAITALSHKPFPTGRAAHGGIAAVQTLLARHGLTPDDIASLRYQAPGLIARLVGRPAQNGMRVAYARLCLPYLAAHTLLHGTVGLDAFSAAALADPAVLALAQRVTVSADDNPDPSAFVPALLQAKLRDGSGIAIAVPAVLGSPALPLDAAGRLAKLRACLQFGGAPVSAEDLTARIDQLEQLADAGALFRLACAPQAARLERA